MDVSLLACVNKQGQIRASEAGKQGPRGEKALGSKRWGTGGREAVAERSFEAQLLTVAVEGCVCLGDQAAPALGSPGSAVLCRSTHRSLPVPPSLGRTGTLRLFVTCGDGGSTAALGVPGSPCPPRLLVP